MTWIIIVLIVVLGLLYSEYNAKVRRVKQLEDILSIAQSITGFWYTFNEVVEIYKATYVGKHAVNIDAAQQTLSDFMNYNTYHQVFSDVEGFNDLSQYQALGLASSLGRQEVFDKIDEGKPGAPETLNDWYNSLKRGKKN